MDDGLDEFMPLTITGIPSTSRNNDVSLSQTSVSRLSRSYAKRKKSVHACLSTSVDNQCANSPLESIVTATGMNQHKDSHHVSENGLQFCPLCQAPFDIIETDPHVHVNQCTVQYGELKECPKGEFCYDYGPNHYQEYAHTDLAKIRASKGHLQLGTLQYVHSKKEKITSCAGQHFSSPSSPLNSKNEVKKTSSDVVRGHVSSHQNSWISGEQTHTLRRDESVNTVLKKGDNRTVKAVLPKHNMNESCVLTGHRGIVNCLTGDKNLKTCISDKRKDDIRLSQIKDESQGTLPNGTISKDFKFSDKSMKSTEFEGSKSNVSTERKKNEAKESVAAHWKQRLDGMRQRGLSTMAVMSDDTLTVSSDGFTSASNSYSSQKSVGKKTCPSYKRIPGTSFVVDAFQYGIIPGVTHYFLSHFHSDHYGGLRRSFSKPICCSKVTAALVKMKLLVDEQHLHILDLDVPRKINGVLVTALDANHCPGSVMFLFQLHNGQNHLHVGDFRADPKMESYPCFWNLTVDKLFLDTTYCEPRYTFPLQSETVQRVVELAVEHNRRVPSTLFVCGTYTLGKEKVFLGIVEALNCKFWASDVKRKVLECLDNQIISDRLTNRQWDAQVHVCRMSDLNISVS